MIGSGGSAEESRGGVVSIPPMTQAAKLPITDSEVGLGGDGVLSRRHHALAGVTPEDLGATEKRIEERKERSERARMCRGDFNRGRIHMQRPHGQILGHYLSKEVREGPPSSSVGVVVLTVSRAHVVDIAPARRIGSACWFKGSPQGTDPSEVTDGEDPGEQ